MKQDKRANNTGQPKKPAGKKKQPITIYETKDDIALAGGLDEARKHLKAAWDKLIAELKHHAATDPTPDAYENSKPGL